MINRIWYKMSRWNLKAFIPLSIGIHLLLLSVLSLSFPELRINRVPPLDIEVTLLPTVLPVMAVEKPVPKMAPQKPKPEIEKAETPLPSMRKEEPRHLEKLPLPMAKEEPVPQETLLPKSPPPVETVVNKAPIEQPEPIPPKNHIKQEEKQENHVKEVKRTISTAVTVVSLSDEIPVIGLQETLPSVKEVSSKEEIATIIIPSSLSNGYSPPPPSDNGSQERFATVSKLSPPPDEREVVLVRPRYNENPKPVYPPEARKKGYQGVVLLRVEVLANGRVGQVEMKRSSGHEALDRSALAAVKQWKFTPAKKGEDAIPSWVNIPVKFQLQ